MHNDLIKSAESIGLFCRLNMHTKRDLPIRSSEMGVLIFTQKQNKPVTPLMISQFFKIKKPTVTTMVNALVHAGYLIKVPSLSDGRSYVLELTSTGYALLEVTFESYFKTMEALKGKMGSDAFDQLVGLIDQANQVLLEDQ